MNMVGKYLVHKEMKEVVVSRWLQAKHFDLRCVNILAPMFNMTLNVAYGSYDEFKKFLKKEFDVDTEHKNAMAMVVTFEHENVCWHWMNIQKNDWTAEDYGVLAHELHHFTHFSLKEKGITYGEAGEELYAYFQGYFIELVVRAFAQLHKTQKKK